MTALELPSPRLGAGRTLALVAVPSILLVLGPLTVLLARGRTPDPEVQSAAVVVAALPLATPLLLRMVGRRWDPLLLSPAWVLCALGLTVIARVQPDLLGAQLLWITIGWAVFIALAGVPALMRLLRGYRYIWLGAALLLTLSTFVAGADITGQGARLWLRIGPVTMQPAEALRVALIVFLAAHLSERRELLAITWRRFGPLRVPPPGEAVPLLAAVGLAVFTVVAQRDFGPSLVFVSTFLGMLYLATGRRDQVLLAGGVFGAGALAAFLASARLQERIGAWLDPWADPQGTGYQSLQAIGGLVFGGVTGAGPGYGYPGLIPAAHTDYPLAAIGEEWGLLGALAVIMLYGLLVARGLARAQGTGDRFAQLLAAGLALSIGVQALIVLGGVLRLLPLTGITSPFLSYGGSSMVMGWIILALLLRAGSTNGDARFASLDIARRLRHVGIAVLAGFVALAGTLGYWQVVRADALAADPSVSGPRLRLEAARITRGSLLDRNGEVLAETVIGPDGAPQRRYLEPSAVHVVGFDSIWLGAAGAEAASADLLMGRQQLTPADTLRDLLRHERAGADVGLTIDLRLQRAAAEAMGGAPGALVALDPRTGDVLALVSNPTFPPDIGEEQWVQLRNDARSPLLNRATQGLYPPGSTFKTVTLAAALEAGIVAADDATECPEQIAVGGVPVTSHNEPPGRRTETVRDAYAFSCNTFFARLGAELGRDRLVATAEAFGLTEEPPFPLPTSQARLSRSPAFLDSDGGVATTAFGQGELQLTPLHLALVAAAVANDGVVPQPRLFLHEAPGAWRTAMSPEAARALAAIMERAAEDGWAASAGIPGVRVGAKTGSAEVAPGEASHALTIAFASVGDPRIAVAVIKEHAGAGSREAAPVARAVIEAWLSQAGAGAGAR